MASGKGLVERKKNFRKVLRVSKLDLEGKVWKHWRKRIMWERNKSILDNGFFIGHVSPRRRREFILFLATTEESSCCFCFNE